VGAAGGAGRAGRPESGRREMAKHANEGWSRSRALALGASIVLAMGLQGWKASHWRSNFGGDEAVFGLMARHIIAGQAPVYVYGQHHLGSFDAFLGALSIHLFGQSVFALRLPSVLLFGGWLWLFSSFVRRWFGVSAAVLTVVIVALTSTAVSDPSLVVFPMGMMSLTGTLALRLMLPGVPSKGPVRMRVFFVVGLCFGLALWLYPLGLTYFLPLPVILFLQCPWWKERHVRFEALMRRRLHLPAGMLALPVLAALALLLMLVRRPLPTVLIPDWILPFNKWFILQAVITLPVMMYVFRKSRRAQIMGLVCGGAAVGYLPVMIPHLLFNREGGVWIFAPSPARAIASVQFVSQRLSLYHSWMRDVEGLSGVSLLEAVVVVAVPIVSLAAILAYVRHTGRGQTDQSNLVTNCARGKIGIARSGLAWLLLAAWLGACGLQVAGWRGHDIGAIAFWGVGVTPLQTMVALGVIALYLLLPPLSGAAGIPRPAWFVTGLVFGGIAWLYPPGCLLLPTALVVVLLSSWRERIARAWGHSRTRLLIMSIVAVAAAGGLLGCGNALMDSITAGWSRPSLLRRDFMTAVGGLALHPVATFNIYLMFFPVAVLSLCGIVLGRRRRAVRSVGCLGLGVVMGAVPIWGGYLFLGAPTVWPVAIREKALSARLGGVGDMLCAMWMTPRVERLFARPAFEAALFALMLVVAVGSVLWFAWRYRRGVRALATASPMDGEQAGGTLVLMLLVVPIATVIWSGRAADVSAMRYLVITWQASAAILAVLLSQVAGRWRATGIVLVAIWLGWLGFIGVSKFQRSVQGAARYPAGSVEALEEFLRAEGVSDGYAEYVDAYGLDFLTQERLRISPYNVVSRMPWTDEEVRKAVRQVYVFRKGVISPSGARVEDMVQAMERSVGADVDWAHRLRHETLAKTVVKRRVVGVWDVWLLEGASPGVP
jgi:hypothetical protein